jgi:hypothetical protein
MTRATPPLLRRTRGARPKTDPPARRRERRRDPKPHGSRTGATGAAPWSSAAQRQGRRSVGRIALPRPLLRGIERRRLGHLPDWDDSSFSSSRRRHRRHVRWARGHVCASRLLQHNDRLGRRAGLGNLLHDGWCRQSPPLWSALREGQLNSEAQRDTGCGSRRRLKGLPGSQIGQAVASLAEEERKVAVETYEREARTKTLQDTYPLRARINRA